MALLCPFRAYRYDPRIVGDLALVATQPYDKISPVLQEEYYRRSLHNVIRVTRSLEKRDNPETDYPDAARTLQSWIDQGVLVQDPVPGFYAYCQRYDFEGEKLLRTGLVALLDLQHSAAGILPHERTLVEPKMDRLRLLRSIECNEDMVFTIYTEDKLKVNRILEDTTAARRPEIDVKDDFGAVHRLWTIGDPKSIRKIQEGMVPEELFIADGQHRVESALAYKRECEARGWKPAAESFASRMVACFNSADGGITILPTYRLIHDVPGFAARSFLETAGKYFASEPCTDAADLWEKMALERDAGHVFGFYARKRFHLLRLKVKVDSLMLAHAEAYRNLDVSVLHAVILDRLLGIDEGKIAKQLCVDYVRDRDLCVQRVNAGAAQAAFFLNPVTVEQVQRVALLGERLPQESTDFYPKLLTGLLFMKMQFIRD